MIRGGEIDRDHRAPGLRDAFIEIEVLLPLAAHAVLLPQVAPTAHPRLLTTHPSPHSGARFAGQTRGMKRRFAVLVFAIAVFTGARVQLAGAEREDSEARLEYLSARIA